MLPKGTRLMTIPHFDDSANNPTNPDPTCGNPYETAEQERNEPALCKRARRRAYALTTRSRSLRLGHYYRLIDRSNWSGLTSATGPPARAAPPPKSLETTSVRRRREA